MRTTRELINEIKNIISIEIGNRKVLDKDVALALGISSSQIATYINRQQIPFQAVLDFAAKKCISINTLLYGQSFQSLEKATSQYDNRHYNLTASQTIYSL